MAKRKTKLKTIPKSSPSSDGLRRALAKQKKSELIQLILDFAKSDRSILRQLELQFNVEPPPEELVAATRLAISDATDFDERQINHNFDYDYGAYETVKRNFIRLVKSGHLPAAMELSLELMHQGSFQVEMSDEGLMTQDIEECLEVVIKAINKSDLAPADVWAWCEAMTQKDRVKFICYKQLDALRPRFQSPPRKHL